jgi:hypothetical protein
MTYIKTGQCKLPEVGGRPEEKEIKRHRMGIGVEG